MKTTLFAIACLALSVSCRSNHCSKAQEAPAECPASAQEPPATPRPTPIAACNRNGVDDSVDIANGTSLDADLNGIPDECEHN